MQTDWRKILTLQNICSPSAYSYVKVLMFMKTMWNLQNVQKNTFMDNFLHFFYIIDLSDKSSSGSWKTSNEMFSKAKL